MKKRMTRNEEYERNFEIFINSYKRKSKDEIIEKTLEIKNSSISEFENILLNSIRTTDLTNLSVGTLVGMQSVLQRLINSNAEASELLSERLRIVQNALKNN